MWVILINIKLTLWLQDLYLESLTVHGNFLPRHSSYSNYLCCTPDIVAVWPVVVTVTYLRNKRMRNMLCHMEGRCLLKLLVVVDHLAKQSTNALIARPLSGSPNLKWMVMTFLKKIGPRYSYVTHLIAPDIAAMCYAIVAKFVYLTYEFVFCVHPAFICNNIT